jgi:hypothetical protein
MTKMHYTKEIKTARTSICGKSTFTEKFPLTEDINKVTCERCRVTMIKRGLIKAPAQEV